MHLVGDQDEVVAPNGAVGAPAGAGVEVWGPGGVSDHSSHPGDVVWTQGRVFGALCRGWDDVVYQMGRLLGHSGPHFEFYKNHFCLSQFLT